MPNARAALLALLLSCGTVVACVPVAPQPAPRPLQIVDDAFDTLVTITGRVFHSPTTAGWTFFLRTFVSKRSGATLHQYYAVADYKGRAWEFWERAQSDEQRSLRTLVVSRSVAACGAYSGCFYREQLVSTLPDELLARRQTGGFLVKFYSQAGNTAVLPASEEMIREQLQAVANVRTALKLTPPSD